MHKPVATAAIADVERQRDPVTTAVPLEGSTRVGVARHLPAVLRDLGVDPGVALQAAGVRPDIFDDPGNTIEYAKFAELLAVCGRLTNCDHVAMLVGMHARLADFGLVGRYALCGDSAGQGLRNFVEFFNLHSTASTACLVEAGSYVRLVYAISVGGITDAAQFQFGSVTAAFNVLKDLFGQQWQPAVVTFATGAPANLRPFYQFFRAPLRFDSDESAVIFERQWLDRPLPPVDEAFRRRVDAEVRATQAAWRSDFPATVRRVLRKQLIIGPGGMDDVASMLGMHRRTLDRHLLRHGVRYGEILEAVKLDVARQLLRNTSMQVQQVAESLHFSSAANFATAFRRWTGATPSEFRRGSR